MASGEVTRRLAAIVAADVAGYSRLVAADEEATLSALRAFRTELIDPKITEYRGRVANTAGDSILIEFPSVIEALRCAIDVQQGMAERNAQLPEDRRIQFRVGLNLGDVVDQDGDLLGDGVNVAARLEGLAEPGGICISRAARDQVRDRLDVALEDLGEVDVKNIPRPVRAFRVLANGVSATVRPRRHRLPKRKRPIALAVLASAIVAIGSLLWLQPWTKHIEAADVARMAYPLPDKPSIAVLPFGNLSDDAGQDFFAAGITDDIITDLSKISGLFVTAPHATQSFKGKDASVREISEALGVRYVLSGSVRRDGERARITAQLADALRGDHIWSNRYDRELVDVFGVQSEVTKRVVTAMEVTLKAREQDRVYQKYVTNIDAYDSWQRARAMVEVPSKKNILEAEGLFQKTIELDPSFAGGYAGLSFNHSVKARFGYGESREADVDQAYKLAEKAIATDPSFAWSHIAMAGAHLARLEHDAAIDSSRNALAIQPGGYETNLFMAFYLAFGDKPALSVQYAEAADNLSRTPTYRGLIFLGIAYLTAHEYAKSEAALLNAKSLVGRAHGGLYMFLTAAQLGQGKVSEATETAAELKRLYPNFRVSGWGNLKSLKSESIRRELVESALSVGIPE